MKKFSAFRIICLIFSVAQICFFWLVPLATFAGSMKGDAARACMIKFGRDIPEQLTGFEAFRLSSIFQIDGNIMKIVFISIISISVLTLILGIIPKRWTFGVILALSMLLIGAYVVGVRCLTDFEDMEYERTIFIFVAMGVGLLHAIFAIVGLATSKQQKAQHTLLNNTAVVQGNMYQNVQPQANMYQNVPNGIYQQQQNMPVQNAGYQIQQNVPVQNVNNQVQQNAPVQNVSNQVQQAQSLPKGKLTCLAGSYAGYEFVINHGDNVVIGNDPTQAGIVVKGDYISGAHFAVVYNANTNQYTVYDRSQYGIYNIYGQKLNNQAVYNPGMIICFGNKGDQFRLG